MKKEYMGLVLLLTALLLGGCTSGTDETTTAAQTTVEETETAEETVTESVTEETTGETTGESSVADTAAEAEVGYSEEDRDEFLAWMDDCASTAPGTAGTSLRTAAAAGALLDWEEDLADSLSEEDIKNLMVSWKEKRTDDAWAYLQESWSQVAAAMRDIAEDPEGQAALLEDAGYSLEHTSYRTDVMEMVIGAIEEALSE